MYLTEPQQNSNIIS